MKISFKNLWGIHATERMTESEVLAASVSIYKKDTDAQKRKLNKRSQVYINRSPKYRLVFYKCHICHYRKEQKKENKYL